MRERVRPTDTVLDLGCGDGRYANIVCAERVGVDVWDKYDPDIVLNIGTERLPFRNGFFNVVFMLDIIEHLDSDGAHYALAEAKRVTGRELILLTPLWWETREEEAKDNPHMLHKTFWKPDDFEGFKRHVLHPLEEYFLGIWRPDVES